MKHKDPVVTATPATPKQVAEREVDKLQREKAECESEVVSTRDEAARLYQCFKVSNATGDMEAASRADMRAKRARDLLAEKIEEIRVAEDRKRAAERVEIGATYADNVKELRALQSTKVEPRIAAIVELDEQLASILLSLASDLAEGSDLYARACDRARTLNEPVADLPRPDLKEVKLTVQKRIAEQRQTQARPDWSSWFQSAELSDWKIAGMSASELDQYRQGAARARQDEERMRQQSLVALGANAVIQKATREVEEEEVQ